MSFRLLVAPGVPWLVAVSLHLCLHFSWPPALCLTSPSVTPSRDMCHSLDSRPIKNPRSHLEILNLVMLVKTFLSKVTRTGSGMGCAHDSLENHHFSSPQEVREGEFL